MLKQTTIIVCLRLTSSFLCSNNVEYASNWIIERMGSAELEAPLSDADLRKVARLELIHAERKVPI